MHDSAQSALTGNKGPRTTNTGVRACIVSAVFECALVPELYDAL